MLILRVITGGTFEFHPASQTLIESTRGALLPGGDGDGTVPASQTHVVLPILNRPLEEALARLARKYPVVEATDFVAANWTRTANENKLIYNDNK